MLRLRFAIGDENRVFPLTGGRVRLGRGGDNDIVLADVSVSRNHAEIRRGPDGWHIHDLRSTNGVEINRVPVRSAPLHPGDRITVGVFELEVESVLPPPQVPGAAPPSLAGAAALSRTPAGGGPAAREGPAASARS